MLPERNAYIHALRGTAGGATLLILASGTIAWGDAGGAVAPDAPRPQDATCIKRCLDVRSVAIGGKVVVTGENLAGARSVYFPTRNGQYVGSTPNRARERSLKVKVPQGATSGKPVVSDELDQVGTVPRKLKVKAASAISTPKGFKITAAKVSPKRSFVGGRRPTATYVFKSKQPVDVRVDITNTKTGELVNSIVQRRRDPYSTHKAKWNGQTSTGGAAATGKYRLALTPLAGGNRANLQLQRYSHIFPLRTKHKFGDGLGAGRGHMGQDIFGKCGAPVVAARGGRVTFSKYQARAGYYVVIDGVQTKLDYMYAHLQKKGRVKKGQRVKTGQVIGYNGATGNASGCHVHMEIWRGRWQQGGTVINPTRLLKRWDRWS